MAEEKVLDAAAENMSDFRAAMADKQFLAIPKVSDVIKGTVIAVGKNEVRIDIDGYRTGVVRGREVIDPSREYSDVEVGDEVEATVIELENENGDVELSFRFAGHRKAWDRLTELFKNGEGVAVKIVEASKGGLLVRLNHIAGFLPVSQLAPENYPRVAGGDKGKILEKLKKFVGTDMDVRVLDVNEQEEKLIVSEKAIWEEKQKNVIAKYQIGDVVEGEVSALADFGAFVKFDILEGLVHISEIAWQRIDHPRNLLKVGDTVKAEVIGIEGSKIFLSMKKLVDDPWKNVTERYRVGQKVKGTVLKVNPFGFFVELDPEIHGLAHISELSHKPVDDPNRLAKAGDILEFIIVSIEPDQHRLGLSLKALEDEPIEEPKKEEAPSDEADAPTEEPEEEKAAEAEEAPAEEAEAPAEEAPAEEEESKEE